jgi:hypothetical protein
MASINEWYGAYNIIYKWFENEYGHDDLKKYWRHIARCCYKDLAIDFKVKGLEFIKDYFEWIFQNDGGRARGTISKDIVMVEILESPDYKWMNFYDNPNFKTVPYYFEHYEVIFGEIAKMADLEFKMIENRTDGKCKWEFRCKKEEAYKI